jgi:hypothetical protein
VGEGSRARLALSSHQSVAVVCAGEAGGGVGAGEAGSETGGAGASGTVEKMSVETGETGVGDIG